MKGATDIYCGQHGHFSIQQLRLTRRNLSPSFEGICEEYEVVYMLLSGVTDSNTKRCMQSSSCKAFIVSHIVIHLSCKIQTETGFYQAYPGETSKYDLNFSPH